MNYRLPAAFLLALSMAACAGFPARHKPLELTAPAPLDDLPLQGGGAWPAANWWSRYQDDTLDQLIDMAIAGSPTLATAHARFESAEQSVRLAAATSGAHVTANGDFSRQRLSDNSFIPPHLLGFSWYNQADLGLQATYTFDWWGKQRYAVEGAIDQARAAQADRSAALLLLASSVADTYFGWQADESRLTLARDKESRVQLEGQIARARMDAQLQDDEDIHRADLSLAAVREQEAMLEGSAKLRLVALAALVGRAQSQLPTLQARAIPVFPGILPDAVRLDLIARRADITASRWRVQAAEKNLDSARAEFFPDVSVNALLGVSSIDVAKLLEYGSRVPMAGAAIHLPIFDAGRLKAQYGASRAAIDSAMSTYQDTVISAAREVAMQAETLAQIDAQRQQRTLAVDAALKIEETAAARVRQGVTDKRAELSAEESWLEQRDAMLQLDAAALAADIALQRALGGGYDPAQRLAGGKP